MTASEILLTIHTDTKEEEKEIVEQFLNRLDYSPKSTHESECPDFEIEIQSKLIGIEITKYYSDFTKKGSLRQRRLSEWKRFAEELKKKLSNINSDYEYLYGAIHFHTDQMNYRQLLSDSCINEFDSFIKSLNLKREEQKSEKVDNIKFPFLSQYLESIYLWDKYPDKEYLWWESRLQTGEVIKSETAIQDIIDKKEISAKKYKTNYSQKWLLIYAAGLSIHDMFDIDMSHQIRQGKVSLIQIDNKNLVLKVNSNYFTHIFIWDKFTERIFQLFPYMKKIFDFGVVTT